VGYRREDARYWNQFLPFIAGGGSTTIEPPTTASPLVDVADPYRTIMWVLVAFILLLIVALVAAFVFTRRWKRSHSDLSFR